jgi:2-polyprenyl-6-hydroxyphenyl methylase/3-demethylubiquinone-9 3-methyltransferase
MSSQFDKLLPGKYTIDGNHDYRATLVPKYLKNDLIIYDVGGGKSPYLDPEKKKQFNARVIGLDVSLEDLNRAPAGSYDEVICADIMTYRGKRDADIVLCQALLEHVKDVEKAFRSLSGILKPGGLAILFSPNRHSLYARLNRVLPQSIKKLLLHAIFPAASRNQGFPAYYNKCTPAEFRKLSEQYNLSIVEERYYYISSYFSFFFPLYLLWRLWVLLLIAFRKERATETFSMVLQKGNSGMSFETVHS